MKISEIFYSIEGEGLWIGKPEIFIRLSGCNLRCKWCDTAYSWKEGKEMGIEEIMKKIIDYETEYVSITGGEPLLQRTELYELIKRLKSENYKVQINTNGTIYDGLIFELVDLISMDCKCPSSGMKSDIEVLKRTIRYFGEKTQIKFVVSDLRDLGFAYKVIAELLEVNDRFEIIFQLEWNSKKKWKDIVESIKISSLRCRVLPQIQKIIYGVRRGV